jgi:hypothetical protein
MRRYRHRQRLRRLSVRTEVDRVEIDALIKRGYLDPEQRGELAAIGGAVSALISEVLISV